MPRAELNKDDLEWISDPPVFGSSYLRHSGEMVIVTGFGVSDANLEELVAFIVVGEKQTRVISLKRWYEVPNAKKKLEKGFKLVETSNGVVGPVRTGNEKRKEKKKGKENG